MNQKRLTDEELELTLEKLSKVCNELKTVAVEIANEHGMETAIDAWALVLGDWCGHMKDAERSYDLVTKAIRLAMNKKMSQRREKAG